MLESIKEYRACVPAVEGEHPDWGISFKLIRPQAVAPGWSRESWKNYTARQQPVWPEPEELIHAGLKLRAKPPLVPAREVSALKAKLALAVDGNAFILQGGDCSENFARNNSERIFGTCKILTQMAFAFSLSMGRPVVKIGRMAGQFAKPRSSDTQTVGGMVYPAYRGDLVNDAALDQGARVPDPRRILKGYEMARHTLEVLKGIGNSGVLSISNLKVWHGELRALAPVYDRHRARIDAMGDALEILNGAVNAERIFNHMSGVYTSHEALLLPYESGLIRRDDSGNTWYGSSGHMLWIGERTRQPDSAHVELLRGLANPIGIKVGPDHDPKKIRELCGILNPLNEPGRLSLITRFGRDKIRDCLPPLIRELTAAGCRVVWITDPMHGNTFTSTSGYKTRKYADILSEIRDFFSIHHLEKTIPGGIHLEMTGEDVTECLGGSCNIRDRHLKEHYLTTCDPRLNGKQCLELACDVAGMAEKSGLKN